MKVLYCMHYCSRGLSKYIATVWKCPLPTRTIRKNLLGWAVSISVRMVSAFSIIAMPLQCFMVVNCSAEIQHGTTCFIQTVTHHEERCCFAVQCSAVLLFKWNHSIILLCQIRIHMTSHSPCTTSCFKLHINLLLMIYYCPIRETESVSVTT